MINVDQNKNDIDIASLINDIKSHLNVVNAALIQPEDYSPENYEDLLELNNYMKKKQGKLTLMEVEGVLDELRSLRQTK